MQSLKIYQSLWAMELRSPDRPERSHEESFRMVAEAGYDGMCLDPSVSEIPQTVELKPLFERFKAERNDGERFGDWCHRVVVPELEASASEEN